MEKHVDSVAQSHKPSAMSNASARLATSPWYFIRPNGTDKYASWARIHHSTVFRNGRLMRHSGAEVPADPEGRFASRELVSISRSHDGPARRAFVRLAPISEAETLSDTRFNQMSRRQCKGSTGCHGLRVLRNDMLDVMGELYVILMDKAVFTTTLGACPDQRPCSRVH